MSSRSIELFLNDIIEAINRIEDYTENMDFLEFEKNNLVVDAVIRNLEVIGEASKYIPEEIRINHPELPWTSIVGLKNIAIHKYFKIDLDIIWNVLKRDIPETKKTITKILRGLESQNNQNKE